MKKYDQLKKVLRDYHVDIDKDKLWQQTSHAIPKREKRPGLLIPLLLGALITAGGLIIYTIPTHENVITAESDSGTLMTREKVHDASIMETKYNNPSAQEPMYSSKTSEVVKDNGGMDRQSFKANPYASSDLNNDDISITSSPTGSKNNYAFNASSSLFNPIMETSDSHNQEHQESYFAIKPLSKSNGPTEYISMLSIVPLRLDFEEIHFDIGYDPINPLPRPRHIFSLALLQGIGFANLNFQAGNQEAEGMREFLSPMTRSLESISTTLRGNVELPNGFSVSGGLRYNQLTTETKHLSTTIERSMIEGTTAIIIDENGHQQFVSGNLGGTHIREMQLLRYTTHQNLDVEMTLYKTLFDLRHTKIKGYVKAGINVFYAAEGSAFNGERALERFTPKENPFLKSSPFTYGAGVDVQYRLNNRYILQGAAGYDQLHFHHQDANQLQWKHAIYSFSMGIGYVL